MPKPNTDDQIIQEAVKNHGTTSVNYVSAATNQSLITGLHGGFLTLVASGSASFPAVTVTNPGTGLWSYGGTTSTVYTHNLGYTPTLIVYLTNGAEYILVPYTNFNTGISSPSVGIIQYSASVDSNNVYFSTNVTAYGAAQTGIQLPGKFYLLQQPPT